MKKAVYVLAAALAVCALIAVCGCSRQENSAGKNKTKEEKTEAVDQNTEEIDNSYVSATAVIAQEENTDDDDDKSGYDIAYKFAMEDWFIFYLIDTDNNQVVRFTTGDPIVQQGTYTGDLDEVADIEYSPDDHELIKRKEKGNDEILLSTGDFDPNFQMPDEYTKIEVKEALEELKNVSENSEF